MFEPDYSVWLPRVVQHLQRECYSEKVLRKYPPAVRRFIDAMEKRGLRLELVSETDVVHYLDSLRNREQRPLSAVSRSEHQMAVHLLLKLVHDGEMPPKFTPRTAGEIARENVIAEYETWMADARGLSPGTRARKRFEARSLLLWLHEHRRELAELSVSDLDAYIEARSAPMRRKTVIELIGTVRGLLRYFFDSRRTASDLSACLEVAPRYVDEGIPSTIDDDEVERLLGTTMSDHSALGRRDYAILMLLVTYGLRSSEIVGLRLGDIDWCHERLRIRHAKSGICSQLPLMRGAADALLDYLQQGRPTTTRREIFLRGCAPYGPLASQTLHTIVSRRLEAADISLPGKRGPHVFRHTRAAALLDSGVSLKVIGDVLGHRSEQATCVYLKLSNDDLRGIGLEVPQEVMP